MTDSLQVGPQLLNRQHLDPADFPCRVFSPSNSNLTVICARDSKIPGYELQRSHRQGRGQARDLTALVTVTLLFADRNLLLEAGTIATHERNRTFRYVQSEDSRLPS